MVKTKIIIINKIKGSKQKSNGEWIDIIRLKFTVPKFAYKSEIQIIKDEYTLQEAKKRIKVKLKKHFRNTFIPIEYEEVI
ncbi:hypothetical protein LCGC14_0407170 [marine sediment metagenome]|uniref:Uncharacterized protein n=1 Tax=marine sediment metagenome TaxID=412755 RepID=A0A0F9TDB3_9ZZZZ